ncbi:MAG: hypothetical protein ACREJO_11675 [Phycisphaerales bacterium]
MNRGTQITVTHPSHDRLVQLKLQGALHLAKVLESHPSDAMRFKAALALARLAIPPTPPSHRLPPDAVPLTTPRRQCSGEGPQNTPTCPERQVSDTPPTKQPEAPASITPSTNDMRSANEAHASSPPARARAPSTSPPPPAPILTRATAALGMLTRAGAPP